MGDCIFCKIVRGETPCVKVWEDENYLAFLDAFPSMIGQVLLIPKNHLSSYAFELKDKDYSELLLVAKKISRAIDKSLKTIKTGLVMEGLEVDHVHIKLYPLINGGIILKPSLNPRPSEKDLKQIADKIKSSL